MRYSENFDGVRRRAFSWAPLSSAVPPTISSTCKEVQHRRAFSDASSSAVSPTSCEVLIGGGGVMGAATAYFLALSGTMRPAEIVVVEQDPTYEFASTTLSAASIRQQFSTPESVLLSQFGLRFLREMGTTLAVGDSTGGGRLNCPDAQFHEGGYLFLGEDAGLSVLRKNFELATHLGADLLWLDAEGLVSHFPWMLPGTIKAGSYGRSGEGWFDAHLLLHALLAKTKELGVTVLHDTVTGFRCTGSRVETVSLASGTDIDVGTFVNAAGPQSGKLARLAGLHLPVEPRKRCVFVVVAEEKNPVPRCPLVVEPNGTYFRAEGPGVICGCAPPVERDVDATGDFEVDHSIWEETVWPTLASRVPAFEAAKVIGSWAGHYEYNVFDQNGVVGPHPSLSNFVFATGFSGHGLQHAPGVGRGIAEIILTGAYQTIDLTPLSYERILQAAPRREINVV